MVSEKIKTASKKKVNSEEQVIAPAALPKKKKLATVFEDAPAAVVKIKKDKEEKKTKKSDEPKKAKTSKETKAPKEDKSQKEDKVTKFLVSMKKSVRKSIKKESAERGISMNDFIVVAVEEMLARS